MYFHQARSDTSSRTRLNASPDLLLDAKHELPKHALETDSHALENEKRRLEQGTEVDGVEEEEEEESVIQFLYTLIDPDIEVIAVSECKDKLSPACLAYLNAKRLARTRNPESNSDDFEEKYIILSLIPRGEGTLYRSFLLDKPSAGFELGGRGCPCGRHQTQEKRDENDDWNGSGVESQIGRGSMDGLGGGEEDDWWN